LGSWTGRRKNLITVTSITNYLSLGVRVCAGLTNAYPLRDGLLTNQRKSAPKNREHTVYGTSLYNAAVAQATEGLGLIENCLQPDDCSSKMRILSSGLLNLCKNSSALRACAFQRRVNPKRSVDCYLQKMGHNRTGSGT
jgi:hypothetical protein